VSAISLDRVGAAQPIADDKAIAILIANESPGIPEEILISDVPWDVVGFEDREAGPRRTDLHVPDSIQ
jgi:hypothetical protein